MLEIYIFKTSILDFKFFGILGFWDYESSG
jgi:hypothetical protein